MSDNVIALAQPIQFTAAEELRLLADEIETGELGEVRVAIVILDTPHKVIRRNIGGKLTGYETAGLLDAAKFSCFRQMFGG